MTSRSRRAAADVRPQPRGGGRNPPRELEAFVERAVDELPDIHRTVFVLREVQELSTAETAACLDISEEAVKVRLHRARATCAAAWIPRLGARHPRAVRLPRHPLRPRRRRRAGGSPMGGGVPRIPFCVGEGELCPPELIAGAGPFEGPESNG